jgi:hypothetical protein
LPSDFTPAMRVWRACEIDSMSSRSSICWPARMSSRRAIAFHTGAIARRETSTRSKDRPRSVVSCGAMAAIGQWPNMCGCGRSRRFSSAPLPAGAAAAMGGTWQTSTRLHRPCQ